MKLLLAVLFVILSLNKGVCSTVIQDMITAQAALGGGIVHLPPGVFAETNIQIPSTITLEGSGQGVTYIDGRAFDATTITLQSGTGGGLKNLTVYGNNNPATGHNTIVVESGVVACIIRDVTTWLGYSALYIAGNDCMIENVYAANSFGIATVLSQGANWYLRDKFDSVTRPATGEYIAFYQATGLAPGPVENHFSHVDFSGTYSKSVFVYDTNNQAVMVFEGSVFSAPIQFVFMKGAILSANEVGDVIINGSGNPMILIGNWAIASTGTDPGMVDCYGATTNAANVGINFH